MTTKRARYLSDIAAEKIILAALGVEERLHVFVADELSVLFPGQQRQHSLRGTSHGGFSQTL